MFNSSRRFAARSLAAGGPTQDITVYVAESGDGR